MNDHYQQLRQQWRQKIASIDHKVLQKRLPCLRSEQDGLHITYMGSDHVITSSGTVLVAGSDQQIPWNDEMNVLTHLWYARYGAGLSGQWVSFSELSGASPYGPAFLRGNLVPFAQTFQGHGDRLRQALKMLGGFDLHMGDVGFQIDAFPFIPVRVLFWDGDEEFPAQLNLLFDRSATEFIHVESIVTIASSLQHKLTTLAGL